MLNFCKHQAQYVNGNFGPRKASTFGAQTLWTSEQVGILFGPVRLNAVLLSQNEFLFSKKEGQINDHEKGKPLLVLRPPWRQRLVKAVHVYASRQVPNQVEICDAQRSFLRSIQSNTLLFPFKKKKQKTHFVTVVSMCCPTLVRKYKERGKKNCVAKREMAIS